MKKVLFLALAAASFTFASCETKKEENMEKAADNVEAAGDAKAEAVEDAGEHAADSIRDAADATSDKMEDAADKVPATTPAQ